MKDNLQSNIIDQVRTFNKIKGYHPDEQVHFDRSIVIEKDTNKEFTLEGIQVTKEGVIKFLTLEPKTGEPKWYALNNRDPYFSHILGNLNIKANTLLNEFKLTA